LQQKTPARLAVHADRDSCAILPCQVTLCLDDIPLLQEIIAQRCPLSLSLGKEDRNTLPQKFIVRITGQDRDTPIGSDNISDMIPHQNRVGGEFDQSAVELFTLSELQPSSFSNR
jgi:hypothetical protein